jgi:RNA polymerase sigma factor (sigma-70 family)
MPIRDGERFKKHFLGNTEKEANQTLSKYNKTMSMLALKFSSLTGLDRDDLYQEGVIGLARAVREFDWSRSDTFTIFAIYKIKDAMREFVTGQAADIKLPQYIKDAASLAMRLKSLLVKIGESEYLPMADLWTASEKYLKEDQFTESVGNLRESIQNLADRSHTSVSQLLEKAEMVPAMSVDATDYNMVPVTVVDVESDILDQIDARSAVERIKKHVTEEEFQLLWNRYVEGMTLRDLAPIMKISAPHVSDLTQDVLNKLRKLESVLLTGRKVPKSEDKKNTGNTEKVRARYEG